MENVDSDEKASIKKVYAFPIKKQNILIECKGKHMLIPTSISADNELKNKVNRKPLLEENPKDNSRLTQEKVTSMGQDINLIFREKINAILERHQKTSLQREEIEKYAEKSNIKKFFEESLLENHENVKSIIKLGNEINSSLINELKKEFLLKKSLEFESKQEQKGIEIFNKKTNDPNKNKTLILELQGVLQLISIFEMDEFDAIIPSYYCGHFICNLFIRNRKNIGEFLNFISKYFEVIIFSELIDLHTNSICKYLENEFSIKFDFVFGSSYAYYRNSSRTIKLIDFLLGNRKREDILIVDHNIINQSLNLNETVIVPKFKGLNEEIDVLKCLTNVIQKWSKLRIIQ